MNIILATGGLDDVAMALGEAIVGGVLCLVAGLIVLTWWKRSLAAVVTAFILVLADSVLFQPWTVIAPSSTNPPYDAYRLFRLRVISVIWTLLVMTTAACLFRVIRHRKDARNAG